MTHLQVVKALDKLIDASFKRGASNPVEVTYRQDVRALQKLFRDAHTRKVAMTKLQQAYKEFTIMLGPDAAHDLAEYLRKREFDVDKRL